LPKATQKPNNYNNPLRNHDSIFVINSQEEESDPSMFIQNAQNKGE